MAHIQDVLTKLWRPQNIGVDGDLIDPQKIFIDNITSLIDILTVLIPAIRNPIETIVDLKLLSQTAVSNGMVVIVGNSVYIYDPNSNDVGDDNLVVVPGFGIGRYIKVGVPRPETIDGAQTKATTAETNAKAYADNKIAALVGATPTLLDTLDELAQALGDDPNFATTMANALAGKAASQHSHTPDDLSGVMPVLQGGTGQTTLALARNAMGLGNTTGALPIANGGTGAVSAVAALIALGLTATAAELNILDGVTGVSAAEISFLANVTSDIQAQINARALSAPGTITIAASKTLAITDAGILIFCNNTAAINITIPLNSSVPIPLNAEIPLYRYNIGTVTIVPTGGVSLSSSGDKRSIKSQYESVALKKVSTDQWILVGSLA